MDATITTAVIGSVTSLALGTLAWRTTDRARKTTAQTEANATVLEAWRDLVNPVRDELDRERAARTRVEAELEEERKVNVALATQNEALHAELRRLREGKAGA